MHLLLQIWQARGFLGVIVSLCWIVAVFFFPVVTLFAWQFDYVSTYNAWFTAILPAGLAWIVFLLQGTMPILWLLGIEQVIYHAVRRVVPGDNFVTENLVKSMMRHAQWEHCIFGESTIEFAAESHLKRRRSF